MRIREVSVALTRLTDDGAVALTVEDKTLQAGPGWTKYPAPYVETT